MWGCVPCPEDPFCPCVPPPQALLSHRTREVTVSLRATGLVLKTLPASDTEGEELGKQGSWGRRGKEDGGPEMEGAGEGSLPPRPWESRKTVQLPPMPGPGLGTRLPGKAQPCPQMGHHQAAQGDAPLPERVREGVKTGRGSGHSGFVSFLGYSIPSCPPSLEAHSQPRISPFPVSGPTHCTPTAAPDTDHTCLKVSVTEIVKTSNLAGRSFSVSPGEDRSWGDSHRVG